MLGDNRPICIRCGLVITPSDAFTYDNDAGAFMHWRGGKYCLGGAHSAGPANTPGRVGATPTTPIFKHPTSCRCYMCHPTISHSKNCVCITCCPVIPTVPEPEILSVEEKA